MKAKIIILAVTLLVGFSNIEAKEKETSKDAKAKLTTSISGTITDAATGESLVGVKVVLEELNTVVYTDFDGNFEFSEISVGDYTVSTKYVSYNTNDKITIDTKKTKNLQIELKADL
jgi:hypothetical protein